MEKFTKVLDPIRQRLTLQHIFYVTVIILRRLSTQILQ